MSSGVGEALIIVGAAGVVIYVALISIRRSRQLIANWAEDQGYRILHAEQRAFRRGPFGWSSKGQTVWRVRLRDEQGREREGWVRCGSFAGGLLSDQIEVRLDD